MQLINSLSGVVYIMVRVRSVKMPPVESIHRPQVAFFAHATFRLLVMSVWSFTWLRPFIPDVVVAFLEPLFIRGALDERFQFGRDETKGHFFCREKREPLRHVMLEHDPCDREGIYSCTIRFSFPAVEHVANDIEIRFHRRMSLFFRKPH